MAAGEVDLDTVHCRARATQAELEGLREDRGRHLEEREERMEGLLMVEMAVTAMDWEDLEE